MKPALETIVTHMEDGDWEALGIDVSESCLS